MGFLSRVREISEINLDNLDTSDSSCLTNSCAAFNRLTAAESSLVYCDPCEFEMNRERFVDAPPMIVDPRRKERKM